MTKKAYIQELRLRPLGEEGMAKIEQIVISGENAKVNGVMVDLFSASAISKVAKVLDHDHRVALLKHPVVRVADICFGVINRDGQAPVRSASNPPSMR